MTVLEVGKSYVYKYKNSSLNGCIFKITKENSDGDCTAYLMQETAKHKALSSNKSMSEGSKTYFYKESESLFELPIKRLKFKDILCHEN